MHLLFDLNNCTYFAQMLRCPLADKSRSVPVFLHTSGPSPQMALAPCSRHSFSAALQMEAPLPPTSPPPRSCPPQVKVPVDATHYLPRHPAPRLLHRPLQPCQTCRCWSSHSLFLTLLVRRGWGRCYWGNASSCSGTVWLCWGSRTSQHPVALIRCKDSVWNAVGSSKDRKQT